jgi:hypothetical protein
MAVKSKRKMHKNGQAAIEMALSLPFVVFLLYYTINAFYTIHTAHVGQKNAAMNLYQRLNHRAQFAVDDLEGRVFNKTFMAVQYQNEDGSLPKRRILLSPAQPPEINTTVGICREPACD